MCNGGYDSRPHKPDAMSGIADMFFCYISFLG